ncbi:MAG: 6-carboxytetrahydropterin synthase QueD [Candidatus Omnitrophota bacterium]
MFIIKVEGHFSSAHNLKGYKGKCESLHGHNWRVEVEVGREELDKTGMVLDFKFLKRKLDQVLDKLDHKHLNNLFYFKKVNPSSEHIARHIYASLKSKIPDIRAVTVWENNGSSAKYYEE